MKNKLKFLQMFWDYLETETKVVVGVFLYAIACLVVIGITGDVCQGLLHCLIGTFAILVVFGIGCVVVSTVIDICESISAAKKEFVEKNNLEKEADDKNWQEFKSVLWINDEHDIINHIEANYALIKNSEAYTAKLACGKRVQIHCNDKMEGWKIFVEDSTTGNRYTVSQKRGKYELGQGC